MIISILSVLIFQLPPLTSCLDKPLSKAIEDFAINPCSFDFGGGMDDRILQYCYLSDFNSNSYIIYIETPPITLPNSLTDKNYNTDRLKLFAQILNKKITHISVSSTKKADFKEPWSLGFFLDKKVSSLFENKPDEYKVVFDDWNQVVILRVRMEKQIILEIHIDLEDETLKTTKITLTDLDFLDIKDAKIYSLRLFTGSVDFDLSTMLSSLDGRSDKQIGFVLE